MREEHQRLAGAAPVVAYDEVVFVRLRPTEEHIALGESSVAKALGDSVRGNRGTADGVNRIDLDQLFVDVVRELLRRRQRWLGLRGEQNGERKCCDGGNSETHQKLRQSWGCVNVAARP